MCVDGSETRERHAIKARDEQRKRSFVRCRVSFEDRFAVFDSDGPMRRATVSLPDRTTNEKALRGGALSPITGISDFQAPEALKSSWER